MKVIGFLISFLLIFSAQADTLITRVMSDEQHRNFSSSDPFAEISLGNIPDRELFYVFGYNNDVDTGTEVIRANGGSTAPVYTTTSTLSIASSSSADGTGLTGSSRIYIEGVGSGYAAANEYVTLDGTTTVSSVNSYLNINRVSVTSSGTNRKNVGTITLTRASDAVVAKSIPAGAGVSQGSSYTVPVGKQAYLHEMFFSGAKPTAGTDPEIIFTTKIYDSQTNTEYESFRVVTPQGNHQVDVEHFKDQALRAGQTMWMEATTNQNDTQVSGFLSFIVAPTSTGL